MVVVKGDEESLKGDQATVNDDGKAHKGNEEELKCD